MSVDKIKNYLDDEKQLNLSQYNLNNEKEVLERLKKEMSNAIQSKQKMPVKRIIA